MPTSSLTQERKEGMAPYKSEKMRAASMEISTLGFVEANSALNDSLSYW